jgi:hypothetical protein
MPPTDDLKSLDQMMAELGGSADAGKQSAGPCKLLLEHLRAARSSFLGSMPGEYRSSLREAKLSATCISDKNTQTDIRKRLENLIGPG